MLFNSIDFAIFLPIVFVFYWFVFNGSLKYQNLLIVVVSYIFYGWWDYRFLSLILFSTIVDYTVGWKLLKEKDLIKRKILLWISITVNLGFLGVFKYYNFFIENLSSAFSFFGTEISISTLHIVLPVGISFYTFQTLSYTIDVYKGKLSPTKDFIAFSAFVSFFPQLVAGPIERATNLLPQFYTMRKFEYDKAEDGMRQILWGLFKKIVIADHCAEIANLIFNNYDQYSGSTLLIGAIFFSFQIYCDFSGYSDIAIGTARLFGFNLMQNFAFPYFSRDIAEFWRRWHISLSAWFRDYLYIPFGGSRVNTLKKIRNIFLIFIVSGFWHGANWTFIIWGTLNAIYFLPLLFTKKNRNNIEVVAKGKKIPNWTELRSILITFSLTLIAWIFFRSESVSHAFAFINNIFSYSFFSVPQISINKYVITTVFFLLFFILVEWRGREKLFALHFSGQGFSKYKVFRRFIYVFIIFSIITFPGLQQTFIYFQF